MYCQQCRYIMFFSTQGSFVLSWVLINKMVVKIFFHFFAITRILLSIVLTWIPFNQRHIVPICLKFAHWSWRRTFTDWQTDVRQMIREASLSFQLRWAKNLLYSLFSWYVDKMLNVPQNQWTIEDQCRFHPFSVDLTIHHLVDNSQQPIIL